MTKQSKIQNKKANPSGLRNSRTTRRKKKPKNAKRSKLTRTHVKENFWENIKTYKKKKTKTGHAQKQHAKHKTGKYCQC